MATWPHGGQEVPSIVSFATVANPSGLIMCFGRPVTGASFKMKEAGGVQPQIYLWIFYEDFGFDDKAILYEPAAPLDPGERWDIVISQSSGFVGVKLVGSIVSIDSIQYKA